ncbi:ribonuclease E/G [Rhabdochlamydiaceae symbiont of Dictyostelium giganteum]|uniref:Rne/Rng family ribonuclease n=1 Tax=Rhabdochlamydiaceae symbiont of Dictyostelium giganteum TaxID=3342349 RepID=UPI003850D3DE
MSQEILINIESKETRCAFLKNGQLHDLIVERKTSRPLTGNIYRGRVTNILHNIQSAFIDINEGESGFIHISDIIENTQKFQEMFDMDFDMKPDPQEAKKAHQQKQIDIAKILKPDQPVLVQVVKEPIGSKGARLTSNVSIAGRYLVLIPSTPHRGVSRKIEDRLARERLKRLIQAFEMPQDMGLICRTASVNATEEQLIAEANDLLQTWKDIREKFEKSKKPVCLFEESDLIKRALLTAIDKKYHRILVDDFSLFKRMKHLSTRYGVDLDLKIELYRDKIPMFERFGIEKEIDKALRRKIWLPSGGYLFLDRTEAMLTIDVNSGRSKDKKSTSDVEESLVRINMEAADELARQLRLRNIGGLIICDFIDMRLRKNQKRVLERLKDAMKDDSAKCTILGMSEFGLVEMTRQRHRESLSQMMFTPCLYCNGVGMVKSHESTAIEIERCLKRLIQQEEQFALKLVCHPLLSHFLDHHDKNHLSKLAEKLYADLKIKTDDSLHLNEFQFYSTINGKQLDI